MALVFINIEAGASRGSIKLDLQQDETWDSARLKVQSKLEDYRKEIQENPQCVDDFNPAFMDIINNEKLNLNDAYFTLDGLQQENNAAKIDLLDIVQHTVRLVANAPNLENAVREPAVRHL